MKHLRRAWRRLLGVVATPRAERELADEIASHLAMQTEDNLRAGMAPANAERAARMKFGGLEAAKESCRDQRGLPWLETPLTDIRYAVRGLRKSPGFTLAAIAALAVGIGAITAIFSIINTVLFKPLPFPDPSRLVILTTTYNGHGENESSPYASPAMFAHWRAQSGVLEGVSAVIDNDTAMNYTGGEAPELWKTQLASADFFTCAGFRILSGRSFSAEEDSPHGPQVILLGQGLWARRFGSDPAILGRTLVLNGMPRTVIGIVADNPAMLEFGMAAEIYAPMRLDPDSQDQGQSFIVLAHLRPGVTLQQATARLADSTVEYRVKFPDSPAKASFGAVPVREFILGDMRAMLLVLLGAVLLVLLIACANVANLLLARATVRRREFGIRAAIGAGRGRIVRQLLTESVILALSGGALGLLLGYGGIRALLSVNSAGLHVVGDKGAAVLVDWRVAIFVVTVSLLTAVLFGLFPALRGSRLDLNSVLKDGSGPTGGGLRQNRARAALVLSEVSLAVVLLVGSALLIRSLAELYKVDRGFETKNVMTMRTLLAGPRYATLAGVEEATRIGMRRIRALPGVEAAATTCCVPLQGQNGLPFEIVGRPNSGGYFEHSAGWTTVSPAYFEVFGIPVKRGRVFNDRDLRNSPPVVMINEAMAREFWKDGDPLLDRIVIGRYTMPVFKDEPPRQIVGIVADVRDRGLGNAPWPTAYVPQAQLPDAADAFWNEPIAWVVKTRTDPHRLAPVIQEQLRQATGLPVSDLLMMDEVVSLSTSRQRFSMVLMIVFGGAALLLAAMGIYGLMAYTVEQRTHEIGIRLALGAEPGQVRRMVVREGMGLALAGMVIGLGVAWALARTLESLLFGVKARDPMVFVAVPVMLGLVALLAVWMPANRSSKVDAMVALRCE